MTQRGRASTDYAFRVPSATVENYLKTIDALARESATSKAGVVRIAALLGVTKGSVSSMIRKLVADGLAHAEPYEGVRLTAKGKKAASDVLRRHRLIESFLVDVVGLDWSDVHVEAERLEHAVSQKLLDRIDEMLGRPKYDPHGDPIPDALGNSASAEVVPLSECDSGKRVVISRISDQGADFLRFVDRTGLRPGSTVVVQSVDSIAGSITLKPKGRPPVAVSLAVAGKVLALALVE